MPAEKLEQIFGYFKNQPLNAENFDTLWVNTDDVRSDVHPIVKDILKERGLL